jgi:hypothetical protein
VVGIIAIDKAEDALRARLEAGVADYLLKLQKKWTIADLRHP